MGSSDEMKLAVDRVVNGYTWPPAVRVGDLYRTPTAEYRIAGIELDRLSHSGPYADRVARHDAQPLAYDDLEADRIVPTRHELDATRYRASKALVARFDDVLLRLGGAPIVGLFEAADRLGFRLYLVGGSVRDTLLGLRVKDLDLAGTLPVALCQQALKALWLESRPHRRQDLAQFTLPLGDISGNGVLHIKLPYTTDRYEVRADTLIEYSPLRLGWIKDGSRTWWRFGSGLTDDVAWRDVHCNALFYDPLSSEVLDPADALGDLGLRASHVTNWEPPNAELSPRSLVPFDIPSPSPAHWTPKALARLAKAFFKFPVDDDTPARAWVDRNLDALTASLTADREKFHQTAREAQATAKPGHPTVHPGGYCKLFNQIHQAFGRMYLLDELRQPRLEPEHVLAVERVLTLLPDHLAETARLIVLPDPLSGAQRDRSPERRVVRLLGTGLRVAVRRPDGSYDLGDDLPGPDNPSDADPFFFPELNGAEREFVRVAGVDGEVVAIVGPAGTFVETGSQGELIFREAIEGE